jgi:hypothetical protein
VKGLAMNNYVVTVKLASEAIALEAESVQEAKDKALSIMIEQYGQSVAYDASYEAEGEGK